MQQKDELKMFVNYTSNSFEVHLQCPITININNDLKLKEGKGEA